MPKGWILFVPRPAEQAELKDKHDRSLIDVVENWLENRKDKIKVAMRCTENAVVIDPKLLQDEDVTIYVFSGHCLAGRSFANWPEGENKLEYDKIAEGLVGLGLDEKSKCTVKIYSCQSGENSGEGELNEPFAMRIASNLRKRGVVGCKFYGYNHDIAQVYARSAHLKGFLNGPAKSLLDDLSEAEKTSIRNDEIHRWVTEKSRPMGRASRHKVVV